jgi:hypothetical protein
MAAVYVDCPRPWVRGTGSFSFAVLLAGACELLLTLLSRDMQMQKE